ncbi:type IV pilus assembly protein PilX [Pseudomonas nitritireducens]|uniref:Type IV pilus assembly protein PilX n=1 Tax=Pseudomonas nitroreducens TaxID=46680 RepID=A0A7W7KPK3_PSENT|nr:PilX N-terminal domain-containing pilus assembly protein [Pseudomonas nitritireducens]MBB4866607.1 type IV pilus assembly protein PilX [Pseudomonas nitritireducens]
MWRRAEGGAILLVTLVMLLLLTLIGLAGMRLASLEERIAGNLRDRQLAFQAAETALRQGELAARELYRQARADSTAYDVGAQVILADTDLARPPRYQLKLLRLLVNEGLEVGKGQSAYGVALEVSATGYGVRRQPSGEPVSSARLLSIYFIR